MNVKLSMPGLGSLGKSLLARFEKKQISEQEFDKEIAYWMLQFPEELMWSVYPSMPKDLMDYQNKKRAQPMFQIAESFWQQSHIKEYLAKDRHARCQNVANRHWLSFLKRHIPQGDEKQHKIIDYIMNRYPKLVS